MQPTDQTLTKLNEQLTRHMEIIGTCTAQSEKYGRVLLASPPETRYPYIYPRDLSSAFQLFRRLVESNADYESAGKAYAFMKSMAHFIKDVQAPSGSWGQRYSVDGVDKSLYKQEDNVAHGIAILCNYLLAAWKKGDQVPDLEAFLDAVNTGVAYSLSHVYQKELNLFQTMTAIHESAIDEGFTCWANFAFLYAFSLAHEVATLMDGGRIIGQSYLDFRQPFLHSASELFLSGDRYIRRIDPHGHIDFRPDFAMLSPFYFGFVQHRFELERSALILEKQLWDPELGLMMEYLPFYKDSTVHVHAGNGPWLQYTAVLAQFHYWNGNMKRGDELLEGIDQYTNEEGEIPEHLSTCKRFDWFLEREWETGIDFAKEFDQRILLDGVEFHKILEEVNNMARSYETTKTSCRIGVPGHNEGGYIQFAMPLMWSHVEYARALLIRAKDWWKMQA